VNRIMFKGYPVYIPDQVNVDDAIPMIQAATRRADLQVETWKDNALDVAQVAKAGQYVIKWLNDQATIHILPEAFPVRRHEAPVGWQDLWEYRPVLAINLYEEEQYWPLEPVGMIYSELILPSQESHLYWPEDRQTFEYVTDSQHHLPQLHHIRHILLEHVGDDNGVYQTSNSSTGYSQIPSDWILDTEFAYVDHWDPFGNHFVYPPRIFGGLPYEPKTRARQMIKTVRHTIHAGAFGLSGADTTTTNWDFEFIENYRIEEDLRNDFWPEEYIERCVYNPGTYRIHEKTDQYQTFGGRQVYLEYGETWTDPQGGNHAAFLYHEYLMGGASFLSYSFNLSVDGKSWHLYSAGYNPNDPVDDIYADVCKIYELHGQMVVVWSFTFFPDNAPQQIYYGIVWKGALYQMPVFDGDGYGSYRRHDVFGSREEHGGEGRTECCAIGIEEFSETTYPGEINEEYLQYND
jgi:hypothetical protein